ncbi:MAG: hypothetical protein V2B18_19750, partial [Pseudomonadota bacterium]
VDAIVAERSRSSELRYFLERVDEIILGSRKTADLLGGILPVLEDGLDLVKARFLYSEDHPVASLLDWNTPPGVAPLPPSFRGHEILKEGAFMLGGDACCPLAEGLFGEDIARIGAAAALPVAVKGEAVGLLCLGMGATGRYADSDIAELVVFVTNRTALGLANAWDHERGSGGGAFVHDDRTCSDAMFQRFLEYEYRRAWRYGHSFSLMALAWEPTGDAAGPPAEKVSDALCRDLRVTDTVGSGEDNLLWVLLPHTDGFQAQTVAGRLKTLVEVTFEGELVLYSGVTGFTRDAAVPSVMVREARRALHEARGVNLEMDVDFFDVDEEESEILGVVPVPGV